MILTINNLITLNNRSVRIGILPNAEGLDLPDQSTSIIDLPYAEMSALQSNRLKIRKIKFKCSITESTIDTYMDLRDALQQQLYTKDGLTSFTLTTFETPSRTFDFSGVAKISLPLHRTSNGNFDLEITCPDPFLYSQTAVTGSINFTQAGLFIPFILPNYLGGAGNNTLIVNNTGNYKTFSTITLTGAGTNFTITNATTGKSTRLGYYLNEFSLGDTRTVVIDGNLKRVTDEGGSNRYNAIDKFDALEMAVGSNSLIFSAESGNNSNTAALVSFLPRFTHI